MNYKLYKAAVSSLMAIAVYCSANAADIAITSRVNETSPKIVINSRYDFEKEISLKIKLNPELIPSDVLIKKISKLGMTDANGVKITSGFDISAANNLVLAYSGGASEIINAASDNSGVTIAASFKGSDGKFVSPPKGTLALYDLSGNKLCFSYEDVKVSAPKMAFILLLDRSGSMKDVISDVGKSADDFLKILPPSASCALASFNQGFSYHNDFYQSCNQGDFKLGDLKAEGGTDLYLALQSAYNSLSRDAFKDYQKAVIVITDGQIEPDEALRQKLLAAKKDILTFVYFLGVKNDEYLIGLADGFLQNTSEIKAGLDSYFGSIGQAYNSQKILKSYPCAGGSYEATK